VVVIEAPDVDRELEEVARRVRERIDAGVEPHRIAIIARQSRPYVDRATDALRRFGIPAAARLRTRYADIPAVRALLALFRVAAEGWTRAGLVELAEHPYLGAELDVPVLDHIGYRRRVTGLAAWQRELDTLAWEAKQRERREGEGADAEEERRGRTIPVWRADRAAEAFRAFATRAESLDRARTLGEWVEWLTDFVERDPWRVEERILDVPHRRFDVARLDLAGWRGLRAILGEWRRALERWGGGDERLDAAGMEAKLRSILDGDVALTTPTPRGVQVLEALAAAYRAFDHVFIVGLAAGEFPLRPPRTPLLDDADREALAAAGLALERRAVWEQREEELFRVLTACAPGLTLSYAKLDHAGRDVLPSWFVEAVAEAADVEQVSIPTSRVLTPGLPLVRDAAAIEHAGHAARIERLRATGAPGKHNGLIQAPPLAEWLAREFGEARIWSVTQLEAYAKCPWAYFSGRLLRLEKLEDPDEDMEPIVRGSVLHDAMRRFFELARRRAGGPVLLRASDAPWAYTALEAALDAALQEAGSTQWLGHPSLYDARRAELSRILRRYLQAEIEHNEARFDRKKRKTFGMLRTAVDRHEVEFDDVVLERAGVRFRLRGRMDRVEVGIDDRLGEDPAVFRAAVDYKTSEASTPGGGDSAAWDDGVVLQVPLYAHALQQLEPGARVARVEYRALKTGRAVHSLELHRVGTAGQLEEEDDARARYERALDAAAAHVQRVREGLFPAKPAESCGCPPFCHGWDICRVKGGPKRKFQR
jgi:ATP-dependent helicase/DNAse subunit B